MQSETINTNRQSSNIYLSLRVKMYQSDLQMHIGEIEDANQVNYAASQK